MTSAALGDELLETVTMVCTHFGLGLPVSVRPAGGSRHLNLAVATDRGQWLLRRRHADYCDLGRLAFDHRAAAFLQAAGVPLAGPVADAAGATTWRDRHGLWEAQPFITGRPLREGEPGDLAALAHALAHWHRAGLAFPERLTKGTPRGETDPGRLLGTIESIRYQAPTAAYALSPYRQAVLRAGARLSAGQYRALPHTLVHGDVQPANLLMDGSKVAAFVDLDWCAWQPRLYDLCFALLCCASGHAEPIGGGDAWRLAQAPIIEVGTWQAFLAEYQAHSSPLTPAEMAALPTQLTLSWCHIRVDNARKVPPAERAAFLIRPGEDPATLLAGIATALESQSP